MATVLGEMDRLLAPYGGAGAYDREDQLSHRFLSDEIAQNRTMARITPTIFLLVGAFLLYTVLTRLELRVSGDSIDVTGTGSTSTLSRPPARSPASPYACCSSSCRVAVARTSVPSAAARFPSRPAPRSAASCSSATRRASSRQSLR